jgi:hypothetical protein
VPETRRRALWVSTGLVAKLAVQQLSGFGGQLAERAGASGATSSSFPRVTTAHPTCAVQQAVCE